MVKKIYRKRTDKQEIWSMISRLLYQEKFPLISDEIENIITSRYFPTTHPYYIENCEFIINITNFNEHFWQHDETMILHIKPTSKVKIPYTFKSVIDLPPHDIPDVTDYINTEFSNNGVTTILDNSDIEKDNKYLKQTLTIDLEGSESYRLVVKRSKILCKITNPYKTFVSTSIIKDLTLTVMLNVGIKVDFRSRGTVNDFIESDEQTNNDIKVIKWTYKGLILPHQGYILIFKLLLSDKRTKSYFVFSEPRYCQAFEISFAKQGYFS